MHGDDWRPLDFEELRARLVRVRDLLQQATAVGLAQDAERLEAAAALIKRTQEQPTRGERSGHRRYR